MPLLRRRGSSSSTHPSEMDGYGSSGFHDGGGGGAVVVLMVAEKPSLAAAIARFLSDDACVTRGRGAAGRGGGAGAGGDEGSEHQRGRGGPVDVHEWDGRFQGLRARFKMTSVCGHLLSIDFPARYQSWDQVDPMELFDAETVKTEANPKVRADE